MPIYEYECPKCGRFEAVQKATEKPLKANPECSRKDCPNCAKRLISAAAFHLKGSGWYKTDYASGSSSSASSGSSSTSSSDSASDSSGKKKKKEKASSPKGGSCGPACGCH